MKKIVTIAFWALGLVFCYLIYRSITGPIEFKKIKEERYTEVIKKLKDIRAAQDAYLRLNGKYADNFDELTKFIETAQFTITSQRDTSWNAFDETFKITVMRQGVVIDTLGHVSVKDSLFKNDNRYLHLCDLPPINGKIPGQFIMKTGEITDKNNVKSSVFEAYVPKRVVLQGLDEDLVEKEIAKTSVEDVRGPNIQVGSLEELTVNGNWPTSYDAKIAKQ